VLKLSPALNGSNFFGVILMRQNWIHTNFRTAGAPAIFEMRSGTNLKASLCANFEQTNYQPKLKRLGDFEMKS
jgi:hypothetical protein